MKTKKLRILSALLALAMLFALMPTAAFAEGSDPPTSGTCGAEGSNLTWKLENGTLTISGTGAMKEYEDYTKRPWVAYKKDIKKVVIGDEVTTIGKHAFEDCSQLSTVELPQNGELKKIGFNAFGYLTAGSEPIITEIVIPNSVEEIAPYAFNHCTQLATVTFAPDSKLKTIGRSAFQYTAIEEVRIPARVEQLGTEPKYGSGSAFYSCSNLKKVVFESPSELNYVSNGNFSRCSENLIICCMDKKVIQKLTETGDVDKGNVDKDIVKPTYPTVTFVSNGGSDVDAKTVENGKTISAPAAPTKNGYIFAGWYTDGTLNEKYDFSNSVTDDMTLYAKWTPGGPCGATSADKVTWSLENGTLTISGTGAMKEYEDYTKRPWVAYKKDIKKVVIGDEVTTIGKHAFEDCSQLSTVELPQNGELKKIGFNAFGYLTAGSEPIITEIVIPNSVEEIAPYAFDHCTQLATVTFAPDSHLKTIGLNAFQYTAIKEIRIPASVEGLGVKGLETEPMFGGGWTFYNCSNLKKVVFESPSKLNYVSNGNFSGCSEDLIICCMDENVIKKLTETGDMNKGNVDRDIIKPTYPTVTFDFDNGSEVKTEKVENGNTIFKLETDPTKEGYVFDGWYTDVALTQKYDFSKPVIDDMTLYAKWEEVPVDTYVVTVENGVAWVEADAETEAVAAGESICVPEGVTVHVKADETALEGMTFERWEVRKGEVKLENDRAAETTFTMPAGEVQLEAMYQAADVHDSSWDAATVVTGAVIGTGTAILAYHIGMEVYAEQVLGKDVAVPRTRAEVALLAWQLAGSPAVNVEGEPLSEAAQAEKWAVESGLMEPDAEGNFNGTKKVSKWNALRTLDAAKKMG